jgi:hypothetical protein
VIFFKGSVTTKKIELEPLAYAVERTMGRTDAIEAGKKFINFPFL